MTSPKVRYAINLISALSFLFAVGMMFLPLVQVSTLAGETIPFFGANLIFGGIIETTLPSGVYSFSFSMNIFLLIITQAFILGAVSCYLARVSIFNRIVSFLLGLAAFIVLFFTPMFITRTSSLPAEGTLYSYGFYLSAFFGLLGCVGETILTIDQVRNRKK